MHTFRHLFDGPRFGRSMNTCNRNMFMILALRFDSVAI
jgi:hypothetical protein